MEQTSNNRNVRETSKRKRNVREYWTGCGDFVFSSAGYSIGMGNILRFPYLCYKNGGGAFLIPYLICLGIGAFPMYFLEYSVSQFSRRSPLSVWAICPLMKGAGYGMIMVNVFMTTYYNVMNAWVLYFLYNSFSSTLPWSSCNNTWNTVYCCSFESQSHQCNNNYSNGIKFDNTTTFYNKTPTGMELTASEEFWRFEVLKITEGLDDMGKIRVELLICLFLAWLITFLCLCWGIKVSGKIVYFTVTFPYLVLLVFLVRGLTLPGAVDGLKFYIFPKWETLLSTKVWGEAALQIFFSSGMGFGGLLTFASYNKFHNNVYRDAMIGPVFNSGTSIFAGFATFTILGVMANKKGVTVDQVVSEGPGLAFEAYPAAITTFPFPPVWAILFFLMLLSVAIDTQFAMVETILCTLTDEYPRLFRQRRILISAFICICQFSLGIPMVMQAIDNSVTVSVLEKLVLVFNLIQLTPVSYNTYKYPAWGIAIGWIIGLGSFVPIPLYMGKSLYGEKGNLIQRIKNKLKPLPEWGPVLTTEGNEDFDSREKNTDRLIETEESLL